MMEVYRLTVRTDDGARFISDYSNPQMAEMNRNRFLVKNDAFAYNWREGDVSVRIILDKMTSLSIQRMELPIDPNYTERIRRDDSSSSPQSERVYFDTIHIQEAN